MKTILRFNNEQLNDKKIQELVQKEFIDSCEKILTDNQTNFISNYFNKIALILKNLYGNDIFKKIKTLNKILEESKTKFIYIIQCMNFVLCVLNIIIQKKKKILIIIKYLIYLILGHIA
jgi:hypothetical protein